MNHDHCYKELQKKSTEQNKAISEVKHYMIKNNITKDIVGIAVSGQNIESLKDLELWNKQKYR